ncbi:MAG: hypothetical protein HN341_00795 [Verrucomicrobia bacterium]|jgi:hypothetical protein|nr:hypothetical protein [Verrucomicrobiota bacterium]
MSPTQPFPHTTPGCPGDSSRLHSTTHSSLQHVREAIRLWPDASEAPEVPTESTLRQFLASPEKLDPDLVDQIQGSVNCARVLEKLRQQPVSSEPLSSKEMSFLAQLRARSSRPQVNGHEPRHSAPDGALIAAVCPAFGQVWTTRSRVEACWIGGRMVSRWTYQPQSVVLVSAGQDVPWDDTIFRASPVSPRELWGDDILADDELVFRFPTGDELVAHLWLGYPVSACQLAACIGTLPEEEQERLELGLAATEENLPLAPEDGAGLPLDPLRDVEALLARERLQVRAGWLPATADARREWWEEKPVQPALPERVTLAVEARIEQNVAEPIALAAKPPEQRAQRMSFGVKGAEHLLLEAYRQTNGQHWGFMVFGPQGCLSADLDGSIITTSRAVSDPFVNGQTQMPLSALTDGFRVRRPDGAFLSLQRRDSDA